MVFVYGLRQSLLPIKHNHFYLFLCIINLLKCKPNCLFWVGHRDRWEYPRHGSSIHVIERVDSRPLLGRQFVCNIPAWKIKPNETQLSLTNPTTTNDIGWSTIQTTLNLIPDWVFFNIKNRITKKFNNNDTSYTTNINHSVDTDVHVRLISLL